MSAATLLATPGRLAAQTERVIHSFGSSAHDGLNPSGDLTVDASGNLFGTTSGGGAYGVGTVFEFSRTGSGAWTGKLLHSFNNNGVDGAYPGGNLIFDAAGNLYGTTSSGGTGACGTVFELIPEASGAWAERILYNFPNNGDNGGGPQAGVIFDVAGNLYGTTLLDGTYGYGTVFKLKLSAGHLWTESILHSFNVNGVDANFPFAAVVFDQSGNLYGTTHSGGAYGEGAAYELSPQTDGSWSENVLYSFGATATTPVQPNAGFILDAAGNLYSTSAFGGDNSDSCGTIFELAPQSDGTWNETTLFSFDCSDGQTPKGAPLFDSAGNLYGTTTNGGDGNGMAFELSPGAGGIWTETMGYVFLGSNGTYPASALIRDAAGNLYGTSVFGGSDSSGCSPFTGCGTLFEIRP